ncbi:MAG: type II secretion system F family protein [Acidobacteriota bacterium]
MIDAGLPLTQCLELLGTGQQNRAFQRVLHDVRRDLETGSGLAESMARHPRVFDPLYTNMIAAGEAGGILDVILQRLAVHIEKAVKLRRAVRTALIYPVAVISIASLVLIVILWKVIPTFEQLFVAMQAELPLPTRVTIALSRFVGRSLIWFVPSLFLTFLGLRSYHGTYRGRASSTARS